MDSKIYGIDAMICGKNSKIYVSYSNDGAVISEHIRVERQTYFPAVAFPPVSLKRCESTSKNFVFGKFRRNNFFG